MGLLADAKSIVQRDPAAKNIWTVLLLYPGFHILIFHRLAHWFYRHHLHFLARISQYGVSGQVSKSIPAPGSAKALFDHGMGIVIGETPRSATIARSSTGSHWVAPARTRANATRHWATMS
jgi:serine O-acetyltransferase